MSKHGMIVCPKCETPMVGGPTVRQDAVLVCPNELCSAHKAALLDLDIPGLIRRLRTAAGQMVFDLKWHRVAFFLDDAATALRELQWQVDHPTEDWRTASREASLGHAAPTGDQRDGR